MPVFDNSGFDFFAPTWTSADVDILSSVEPRFIDGMLNLLTFLVREKGYTQDATIDLILFFHSIVNITGSGYTFDDAEAIVALCSEFCMIDCVYENQVLCAVELSDNGVLFLGVYGDAGAALEAAICLSARRHSIFSHAPTRPSLSLFGWWEDYAVFLINCLLTKGTLSVSISFLMREAKKAGAPTVTDVQFVDILRKLCGVGLFDVSISGSSPATVRLLKQPAGLFLLFSERVEMARALSLL